MIKMELKPTVKDITDDPLCAVDFIVGRASEDRSNVCLLNDQIKMYAVYDGHGGYQVANCLKEKFPQKLAQALVDVDFDDEKKVKERIRNAFIEFDSEIKDRILCVSSYVGSTAIIALSRDSKTYLAHVGDSRAILVDHNGELLMATNDHDGHNQSEVHRITNLGGWVSEGTIPRVSGSLAVTRAFGDYCFKTYLGEYRSDWYVSVIPKISVFNRGKSSPVAPCDSSRGEISPVFLLLASDGLWNDKYKDSLNVIKMIAMTEEKSETEQLSVNFKQQIKGDLKQLCHKITQKGYQNYDGWKDDITVIIAHID